MNKFRIKTYEIKSEKINQGCTVSFAFLTDLHGILYGKENQELIQEIQRQRPDAILIAGDMLVRTEPETIKRGQALVKELVHMYPVYYALGNHEYQMQSGMYRESYLQYESFLKEQGVFFLHNEKECIRIKENKFVIYGLELPIEYYKKPFSPEFTLKSMREILGNPETEGYQILLAHNPKYGKTYLEWGADLILSGHFHGGVVRFTEHKGLTCPQYLLFPPYCCGDFYKGNRCMLVSAGLGEHTIPIRIHNPRELLMIHISAPDV